MRGGGTNLLQWLAAGGLVGLAAALFNDVGLRGAALEAAAPGVVAAGGLGCVAGLAVGGLKGLLTRRG
jgi:hypothetical protein